PDNRMATDIVGTVSAPDRTIAGYLGVSVLVERIGRRLSTIEFADQSICQVVDQTGHALFTTNLQSNTAALPATGEDIIKEIQQRKSGLLERKGNLYSFEPIESTGWIALV